VFFVGFWVLEGGCRIDGRWLMGSFVAWDKARSSASVLDVVAVSVAL